MKTIKKTVLKFHFSTWYLKPFIIKNNVSKDESFEFSQFTFLFFSFVNSKSSI
jgi:hypothetical protein